MPLAMPGLIEYLVAQERPGGGRLVPHQMLQYQVPYIPPATATVQSFSAINTTPNANDHAAIGWFIASDSRMNPDILNVSIFQRGADVVTMQLATDHIRDGLPAFLVITRDQSLRWELENLSRFPQWFQGSIFYLGCASIEVLELLRSHVRAYSRGPYWRRDVGPETIDLDLAVQRIEAALERGSGRR